MKIFTLLGKNPKLTPKWQGPAKITEINDTNTSVLLPKGKTKILNVILIKKNFQPLPKSETVSENNDLNIKSEPKITGPIMRAMKKLMEQQKATELAISFLCDLTKEHCSMCEWEHDCSDNPLLLDPVFARCYISERCSWFIYRQTTCAKCKLKLGEHLLDHQVQHSANKIDTSSDNAIHKQCYNYKSAQTNNFNDKCKFNDFTTKDLSQLQNSLCANQNSDKNLISAKDNADAPEFNQSDEIFLIDNGLFEPMLSIAKKLLGRQHLNFDQLTPPEQQLWNLFKKVTLMNFSQDKKTQCHSSKISTRLELRQK
jgi:hypothetical protein